MTSVEFEAFFAEAEPRLRRAVVGAVGVDACHDGVAEALTWAWANWDRLQAMENPLGYLYRIAVRRARPRRLRRVLHEREVFELPLIEPGLYEALASLTPHQRSAVWLVHGCGWTYDETAEALEVSRTAIGTHVSRGMNRLRSQLEVDSA